MPQHGDFDSQKWFCGYWMTEEEWLDIHDYAPQAAATEELEQTEDPE